MRLQYYYNVMIDHDHVFNITCTSKIDNDSTDSMACNGLSHGQTLFDVYYYRSSAMTIIILIIIF